jgi:hypothetical protein
MELTQTENFLTHTIEHNKTKENKKHILGLNV